MFVILSQWFESNLNKSVYIMFPNTPKIPNLQNLYEKSQGAKIYRVIQNKKYSKK